MISELIDFYNILRHDQHVPPYAQYQNVKYALDIDREGKLIGISPLGEAGKGVMRWVPALVGQVRTSTKIIPQFLWDSPAYFFGFIRDSKPVSSSKILKKEKRSRQEFQGAYKQYLEILKDDADPVAKAILAFYAKMNHAIQANGLLAANTVEDDLTHLDNLNDTVKQKLREGTIGRLILRVDSNLSTDDRSLFDLWAAYQKRHFTNLSSKSLYSIVDGSKIKASLTHNQVHVKGGQGAGSPLISFNDHSFESYGLTQSENAPMSMDQQFAYSQALQYLLEDQHSHVTTAGNVTVLAWTRNHPKTSLLSLFEHPPKSEELMGWVKDLASAHTVDIDRIHWQENDPCYFLCITPNNARIAVRFFYRNTFGEFLSHINEFYEELKIAGSPGERNPSVYTLVKATEPPEKWQKKRETSGSALSEQAERLYSQIILAVLRGTPLPFTLLYGIESRIRIAATQSSRSKRALTASKKKGQQLTKGDTQPIETFNSLKAGAIKAFYLRQMPVGYTKEDFTVALNEDNNRPSYLLGRLFYMYEWVQDAAEQNETTNYTSSIRRNYFSTASTSPSIVFPQIFKLVQSYQIKLERDNPGLNTLLEKKIDAIIGRLPDELPDHLTLVEQGQFYLGYYQQKEARYTRHPHQSAQETSEQTKETGND